MKMLLDGDEASNNGNWQWIASVGADPAPHYRRLYNPTRQMETLDPRGAYVRRHVPELRAVPDAYLREPWTMPEEVQRGCGCGIGRDYPPPIVDHREARAHALARYRAAASGSAGSTGSDSASAAGARPDKSRL
jgi:deoxyribodipyrimidine photo-lyase